MNGMTEAPRATIGQHASGGLLWSGLVLLALLGGCTGGRDQPRYLPRGPAVVNVVEQDHGYSLDRSDIPAGRTLFRVENRSGLFHDLSLVALPEDMPPIDQQLRSGDRRAVAALAGLPSRGPGSSDAFAVDLAPGRYGLVCFEMDGTGEAHALLGQVVEFRVRAAP